MLTLATPQALLLLALLPVTAILSYVPLRRRLARRAPVVLLLRLLVLGLVILAIADPQRAIRVRGVSSVIFLVDTSASLGPAGQKAEMAWVRRAAASAGPHDQAGVVLFGAAPRLAVPLAHYRTLPDPVQPADGATDIAAALRLGMALLPPDAAGRLVLLSDGRATSGDSSAALALALERRVPVDTVAITPLPRRDVAVRALDVPATARAGEMVRLRIVLHSSAATVATLRLVVDGREARQAIHLPAGNTTLWMQPRLDTPGLHSVGVRVDAPGDTVPQNNVLDAATVVGPPGRVLVVGDRTTAAPLEAVLARDRIDARIVAPSTLPARAADYGAVDGVVLDNVPATALSRAQQRALRDAVYGGGLGLVAVGGANAFGMGNYMRTRLEDVLPVRSITLPHRVRTPIGLVLVIDQSGSMGDDVDGVAKIDMVKVAAASALDRLGDGDAVGVLAFSDSTQQIVPFHALSGAADKARIRRQIARLTADGGTVIYPALQQAERALAHSATAFRHVILLTDGQGEDAPFDALIRRMRREHITVSTIGVGEDVEQGELKDWARVGGGQFHYVADPHAIPRIVVGEARYGIANSAAVWGRSALNVTAATPLLRALAGRPLPPIGGYDLTVARPRAQVSLKTASGNPLLASWQYGLGRAVAWTSDAGTAAFSAAWAGRWSATQLPDFWTDAVRWSMRGYVGSPRAPTLAVQDGMLQLSTSLQTPDGHFDDEASPRVRLTEPGGSASIVPLALSGPGLYTAKRPLSGPGLYTATLGGDDRTMPDPSDVAALAVPYAAEYAGEGVDDAFLMRLAAATGGRRLTRPTATFAHLGVPYTTAWLPLWPAPLLLSLLLFPLDVALRVRHARTP